MCALGWGWGALGWHGGKRQWFKNDEIFFQVNWKPTQHVPALFCLPPTWSPVPPGLFVETESELRVKVSVLCCSWKTLSEGISLPSEGSQHGLSHGVSETKDHFLAQIFPNFSQLLLTLLFVLLLQRYQGQVLYTAHISAFIMQMWSLFTKC